MSAEGILRWTPSGLAPAEAHESGDIAVADSWLVADGAALGLGMHRERFLRTASDLIPEAAEFWDAALAAIPREEFWFPRVEVRVTREGRELLLRLRRAPRLQRSLTLATHRGEDPRTHPSVKGPSIDALAAVRTAAKAESAADDVVILDPLGHIVEGASTAIAWWRGDILCLPAKELERVDSVTARALTAVATAAGTSISWETTTPSELDGLEIWALNALHGPRIVTRWDDGPSPAEEPGRLETWRRRLEALRKPLPHPRAQVAT
ncbi:aminotransferase class IV [Salinibacterium sp. SYSU T00001]|uniref:aminotransferase class IV n=1 Tax=Homoserinimonas sedimenticola TaxID=2986805 RepID=UPI002236302E|nr:aminotransferase class IV [Salinibacterium sedimenticola]MCW4384611.1 aminotransferase class IV [Salinibacterium sedimenticola]